MPIWNNFPYSNTHELNLDYIIETQKKQQDAFDNVIEEATNLKNETSELHDQTLEYKNDTEALHNDTVELHNDTVELHEDVENIRDSIQGSLYQIETNRQNIAVNSARIDEFTHLAEGSTTADAELQDIRVSAQGLTYPTAGDAVRAQIKEIADKTQNIAIGSNLHMGTGSSSGVEFTYEGDNTWLLNGESTSNGVYWLTSTDIVLEAGRYVFGTFGDELPDGLSIQIRDRTDGADISLATAATKLSTCVLDSTIEHVQLRCYIGSGHTYENVRIKLYLAKMPDNINPYDQYVAPFTAADDVARNDIQEIKANIKETDNLLKLFNIDRKANFVVLHTNEDGTLRAYTTQATNAEGIMFVGKVDLEAGNYFFGNLQAHMTMVSGISFQIRYYDDYVPGAQIANATNQLSKFTLTEAHTVALYFHYDPTYTFDTVLYPCIMKNEYGEASYNNLVPNKSVIDYVARDKIGRSDNEPFAFVAQPVNSQGNNIGVNFDVISYNICHYNSDTNKYIDDEHLQRLRLFLGKCKADVLCCQEDRLQIDGARTLPSNNYVFLPVYPYRHGNDETVIHTKWGFMTPVTVRFTTDNNVYFRALTLAINNKRALIVSAHPTANYSGGSTSAESIACRLEQYTNLMQWINGDITLKNPDEVDTSVPEHDYVIICMDSNAATQTDRDNLTNLANQYNLLMANGGRFGWLNTMVRGDRKPLDNILVSNNIIINSFESLIHEGDMLYSDHVPVKVNLTLLD
ncbi:MAG: endonuclease/exonuclease/phosphatase family protein [Erysipelotrichaceae bacterium]|nr:endonuclease/exonuclease/phosphatase family protein [Erysipelotrichaceae bacterium]